MKKLIILMTLCCNFYIFSQEEEVKIAELKEVGNDMIIEILLVEENYSEIRDLLKNYKEDTFFYNYTMGRLAYKENNKKDALNYFAKAQNYDKGNIDLRINLLKIYLTDRAYEKEVKEKFEFFDKSKLTPEQKLKVDKLKEVYEESRKMSIKEYFTTTLSYDTNKSFDPNKVDELYNRNTYIFYGTKPIGKGNFKTQNSVSAKVSLSGDGEDGFSFSLGGEYFDKYKNLNYGIPVYIDYSSTSNNEVRLSTGLNHNRNLAEGQDFNGGVQVVYLVNDSYSGNDLSLYAKYKLSKKINYSVDGKFLTSLYSENMYEKTSATVSISADTVLKEKYYFFGKYTYEYVDGKFEVSGVKRKDVINSLKIGYEQGIFKENMKLSADYTISYDEPNYKGYDSVKNLINASIKWEF